MRGMTARERLMIVLVGVAAIVAAFYLLVYTPMTARIDVLRRDLAKQQTELRGLQELAATKAAKEQEFATLSERIKLIEVRLPPEREIPTLIRQLQDTAGEIGIRLNRAVGNQSQTVESFPNRADNPRLALAGGGTHALWQIRAITEGVDQVADVLGQFDAKLAGSCFDFHPLEVHLPHPRSELRQENALDDGGVSVLPLHVALRFAECLPGQRSSTTSSRNCSRVAVAKRVRNRSMPVTS